MLVEIKYLGPTNTKGSRIRAKCNQGSVIVGYDYGVNDDMRALNAAWDLWHKFNDARKVYDKESKTIEFYEATKYKSKTARIVGYLDNKTFVSIEVEY